MVEVIKLGEYILITNEYDDHYLKIGEVVDIDYYPDGDIKFYKVNFGYIDFIGKEKDIKQYRYDLPHECKVLMFR